jgi:selT/selW/selH-like putative selenoprotein
LEKEFGASPKLIKSSGGVFEVKVDGELVFSKAALGRFPDAGEVAAALRGR